MSTTPKIEVEETLESFKAITKIKELKVHYRYCMILALIAGLAIGLIAGYFLSIEITSSAQSRVVNSIQLSVKN